MQSVSELGPLDPNWFEVLTAQVSSKDGNGSDQEDLCANQEGYFKAPLDRTAAESQLFSTPKVFRHSRVVSPETEGEQSFTADQGNFDCLCILIAVKLLRYALYLHWRGGI